MKKYLLLILLALASVAQAAPNDEQPFRPDKLPPGKAMVYVMTTGFHGHNLWAPEVFLDGVSKGTLHRSIYISLVVDPGAHTLKVVNPELMSANETYSLAIQAVAGQHYYVSLHGVVGKTVKTKNSVVKYPKLSLIKMEEKPALERLGDLRTQKQLDEIMKE
jgi:hypothetical protein